MDHQTGLKDLYKVMERSIREDMGHIRSHLEASTPRAEDLDLAHNRSNSAGVDPSSGSITIANGATQDIVIRTRDGYAGWISGYVVDDDNAGVTVTAKIDGQPVGYARTMQYDMPLQLDRSGYFLLSITNNTGADVSLDYQVRGWLRRMGLHGSGI